MSNESPQYDVAISFLSKDQAVATALHEKLTEGLHVFFYPRSQEALAGTDGLESMRKPFVDDSRVTVVLYREPWGRTPWTRVEATAIKDSCLERGWEHLFFIVLDRASVIPPWVPKSLVRLNYEDFGLEQAVGAIKARVQEGGGEYTPMTALKRAEMYKADELYRRDKTRMSSSEGMKAIFQSVVKLFESVARHCTEITTQGSMQIRCWSTLAEGTIAQNCFLTNGRVGMTIDWRQRYGNSLDGSGLVVSEFNNGLILPEEVGQRMYLREPQSINQTKYSADLSRAREYGWKHNDTGEFISSTSLGERCVIQFIALVNRAQNGELEQRYW